MSRDTNTSNTTRRRVLKTGVLATGLAVGVSPVYASSNRAGKTVSLPKYRSGGEVDETFEVPQEWNEHRKQAKQVLAENRSSFHSVAGVVRTSLSRSSESYGGINGFQITIEMEARSNNLGVFPSEIDQIPISVEKGYPGHDACDAASNNCVEAEGDKYVEGGELIEPEGTNTGGGPGTACCMVTDSNDNERLLTVAHLFGDCGENINGEGVESYNRNLYGDYLGDVEAYSHKNDWAVIDNSGQGIYNDYIDDNDDYPDVAGVLTEYSISYYASLDDSEQPCFYNMGMTTDKTTGKIQKCHVTNDEDCKTFSGHGVKTSCTFARGDSGGPTYAIDSNGDARIVSVTSEFNCPIYSCVIITCRGTDREGAGKSTGMGAYYIENNTGYTIG